MNIVLEKYKHIHFVGIGGISMHMLAIYCKEYGLQVSGSDIKKSKYTQLCKNKGIKVTVGHKRKNIDCADLVVCTGALSSSNIEVVEANLRKIKVIDRAELLACICKNFKYVIGVAGTHGKSTTCAMIYHILRESGKNVSCHIGAEIEGARLKPFDEYLVLECCEYNRSFLRMEYNVAVVLNIDNDHLDCYQNMYNLRNAFKTFLKRAKTRFVFDNLSTACIKNKAIHIKPSKTLTGNKFMWNNKKYVLDNVYGEHNINNATVAIGVCDYLGLSYSKIYKSLKTFKAVGRRCQLLGKFKTYDVITDYAHHPSEISCLYNSLQLRYNNIYIIFQPHTYSRTKLLMYEFIKLFSAIENLFIFKEYSARENKAKGCSAKELSKHLDNSKYIKNYRALKREVLSIDIMEGNNCIVFVGAGDIDEMGEKLINNFGVKNN